MGNKNSSSSQQQQNIDHIHQLSPMSFSDSSTFKPNQKKSKELQQYQVCQQPQLNTNRILLNLLLISFLMAAVNSLLVPFFPFVARNKGVSEPIIGLIFSIAYLGSFLSSVIIGKMLHKTGRKRLILVGLAIQAINVMVFGMVVHIQNQAVFTGVCIFNRVMMGLSYAAFQSVAYAYIPLLFFNQIEKKMAQMETSFGLGQLMGPIIGSGLYSLGGYECPFYVFSVIFLLSILLFSLYLPSDCSLEQTMNIGNKTMNMANQTQNMTKKSSSSSCSSSLSILRFLHHKSFLMTSLVPMIGLCPLGFIMSFISQILSTQYNLSVSINSLLFSISMLAYFLAMPIYNSISQSLNRKTWMSLGIFFNSLSLFLISPQHFFHIPQKLHLFLTVVGLLMLGFGTAFIYIPILPQLILYGQTIYTLHSQQQKVNDISVGFMNSGVNFSLFFSPIIGGFLIQKYNIYTASNIISFIIFIYLILYILFCQKPQQILIQINDQQQKLPYQKEQLIQKKQEYALINDDKEIIE